MIEKVIRVIFVEKAFRCTVLATNTFDSANEEPEDYRRLCCRQPEILATMWFRFPDGDL
jgi:hypothetical protein